MAEDTTKVENNETEMVGEGAPVQPETDPEAKEAEQAEDSDESEDSEDSDESEAPEGSAGTHADDASEDGEQEAEEEMVSEGGPVETPAEVPAEEATDGTGDMTVAEAEQALGGDAADSQDSEYRRRLREYTRELKKLPGQWYIIQSYSGYENKVKTNLDMRIQTLEVEDSIYDVVVPIEQAIELKDGKRKLVKRKLLPGYVLVRMDMNDAAWSVVRETPGVTSFVGNEGNATPVKHRDVAKFLMPKEPAAEGQPSAANAEGETVVAMPEEEAAPAPAHDYKVGEAVTILSGALATVSATISEIDPATGKIQALVSIFGRETPVELTADQIERII
ncbi:transcription termination/antitermination protein NusG [Corynebacterium timonense]|uniref:Transcription termination/antitermination protein NusG n=1 Tax=Corynebacterium timonense TaxID=441500 RepID=A0A1H1SY83_9CORY|nr:transcription termination/antitermination protein NusG [Corynebacterium timonense]SDS52965.1 transcription antitermination protein nusG [Corynebacterium timonense]